MKPENIDWHDSNIEEIIIKYDVATLFVWNDTFKKNMVVICSGLAGITNLCIWDDTIIYDANVYPVTDEGNDFVRNLYAAYDKDFDYGGRSLKDGLIEWRIELVNGISFSIFCLNIECQII